MQFTGEERFSEPPDVLWSALTDPTFLCQCFPGVDRVVRADDRAAAVIVRPGFSFVRGTLEVSFEFVERLPPQLGRVAIQLRGIGSSARLVASFDVTLDDRGSRVAWSVVSQEIGGLLKAVSQGLLQAASQKVAADTWAKVRERLAARLIP